jgi:hypothetical protein
MRVTKFPCGIDVIDIMWRKALRHYSAGRGLTGSLEIDSRDVASRPTSQAERIPTAPNARPAFDWLGSISAISGVSSSANSTIQRRRPGGR